jgi:hypothetical protein
MEVTAHTRNAKPTHARSKASLARHCWTAASGSIQLLDAIMLSSVWLMGMQQGQVEVFHWEQPSPILVCLGAAGHWPA